MLEKPDILDKTIIDSVQFNYRFPIMEIEFLPIGADRNTAVYKAKDKYFIKLRSGNFDPKTVTIPKLFHDNGNKHVISPLPTQSGALWTDLHDYVITVFPYIEGKNGNEVGLTDENWVQLGQALKHIHNTPLSPDQLQREIYDDGYREGVKRFQKLIERIPFVEPISVKLVALLKDKRDVVDKLVKRAERLAETLKTQTLSFVPCHGDIHGWNTHITSEGHLYIVDWDTLILAPKERDLMFVGGGLFKNVRTPEEEAKLFYQGYGETEINYTALAYYRYERIVEDIYAYCNQILLSDDSNEEKQVGYEQLYAQFHSPDSTVIKLAFKTEQQL